MPIRKGCDKSTLEFWLVDALARNLQQQMHRSKLQYLCRDGACLNRHYFYADQLHYGMQNDQNKPPNHDMLFGAELGDSWLPFLSTSLMNYRRAFTVRMHAWNWRYKKYIPQTSAMQA
jgi:hypothetical protein